MGNQQNDIQDISQYINTSYTSDKPINLQDIKAIIEDESDWEEHKIKKFRICNPDDESLTVKDLLLQLFSEYRMALKENKVQEYLNTKININMYDNTDIMRIGNIFSCVGSCEGSFVMLSALQELIE